jgi:hypothetical protein
MYIPFAEDSVLTPLVPSLFLLPSMVTYSSMLDNNSTYYKFYQVTYTLNPYCSFINIIPHFNKG